jgi:hypothetical protein
MTVTSDNALLLCSFVFLTNNGRQNSIKLKVSKAVVLGVSTEPAIISIRAEVAYHQVDLFYMFNFSVQ